MSYQPSARRTRSFDQLRPRLLALLPEERCKAIQGDTDSEHVFHYLRNLQIRDPNRDLLDVLRHGLRQIVEWCREIEPAARIGLNVILTDGEQMVGSRLGRTLYYVEREGVMIARSVASRMFTTTHTATIAPSLSPPNRSAARTGVKCQNAQSIG